MDKSGKLAVAVTAERSIVTVLAVDMVGSTRHIADCDPDDAEAFLDLWFEHVRGCIERAGGLLVHYEGDGGIAVFGWPGPFEDHADRACAAAWDILHPETSAPGPGGQPVRYRVGIDAGLVGLREIRRHGRPRFDVNGATVHLAAKLQQRAPPGEALITARAAELCRPHLAAASEAWTADGEAPAGGPSALRLLARPGAAAAQDIVGRYRQPLIGRQGEIARLRRLLPRAGASGGAMALIGEAGIGKSRLASAVVAEALAAGVTLHLFNGDAQRRATPFAAARELVDGLLSGTSGPARRATLEAAGLEAADIEALEGLLAPAVRPGRTRPPGATPTQIVRVFVRAFLGLGVGAPSLLLVEDLHLIDAESRLFLQVLAGELAQRPLGLLLTGRPEALLEAREIGAEVLRLDPMASADMEALARGLWRGAAAPPDLLARAVERADGVPFVLEELVRALGRGGEDAFGRLPPTVASMIHARLMRLSPRAKALAQALSLLGEEVDTGLAAAVAGADTLTAGLPELERHAFTHPLTGAGARFRHQIIAEACAETLPRDLRQRLHKAALTALAARESPSFAQLALHAEGAGDDVQALEWLWQAGLQARRASAGGSLNLIFARALRLMERLGGAADVRFVDFVLMACASMLQLGEFAKINAHLPRAMALARAHGRPDQACSALSQLGMICWFEGRYDEGLAAAREGLAMARSLDAPTLMFSHQLNLANLLHGVGRSADGITELKALDAFLAGGLEHARLGAAAIPRATVLAFISWLMNATGEYEEGLGYARRALDIATAARDPYSEVLAMSSMGRNLLMLGRNEEAVARLGEGLELSERNGYDAIKANMTGALACALARCGRASRAVELAEACLRQGAHHRTGLMEVFNLYAGYAEALVAAGDADRGLGFAEQALRIARDIADPWLLIEGLGLRARLVSTLTPADPGPAADRAERAALCRQHGLIAWG